MAREFTPSLLDDAFGVELSAKLSLIYIFYSKPCHPERRLSRAKDLAFDQEMVFALADC
jgi:hypothetical protein